MAVSPRNAATQDQVVAGQMIVCGAGDPKRS